MKFDKYNTEKLYINGQYIDSSSNEFIEVENPANQEIVAKVPRANEDDVKKAIDAASDALDEWSKLDLSSRISYIEKFKQWLVDHEQEILETIKIELGVPKRIAKPGQFSKQIDRIDTFIEKSKEIEMEVKMDGGYVRYEPIGVVASITPWNYPLGQIVQKVIPALLTGCTVVEKPASNTPLTAYVFTRGLDDIDLPKGVFNLITGKGSEVGNILNSSEKVSMISYTGSLEGGASSAKLGMESAKKVVLELGGKSPAIFLEGADIKSGVKQVLDTVYLNVGQTCSCLSRAIITEEIYEQVIKEFESQYDNYPVGDPSDDKTVVGSMSSKDQYEKVKSYIESGLSEGATLLKGEVPEKSEKGYYIKPVIFTDVKVGMKIHNEEIFGPVLSIIKVKDKDEAIRVANSVEYGLSSAVFAKKDLAISVAEQIKAGEVYINNPKPSSELPFGGYKKSGIGREGGIYGLMEYLEIKAMHID